MVALILILIPNAYSCHFSGNIEDRTEHSFKAAETLLTNYLDISKHLLITTTDPETIIKTAKAFLSLHESDVNFNVKKDAEPIQFALENAIKSSVYSAHEKCMLSTTLAGIYGKISDKLRSNGGVEYASKALNSLKNAVIFDSNSIEASKAYAKTIKRFTEQNFISRKFIESSMSISIEYEANNAMKALSKTNQNTTETYRVLKSFVE